MSDTPTPGQVAYEAFWQAFAVAFGADADSWDIIHPGTQRAWDAAAQAVLAGDVQHTYPSNYPPGTHWATDEAWAILDTLKPGVISDDVRFFLAGSIAGTLMRIRRDAMRGST